MHNLYNILPMLEITTSYLSANARKICITRVNVDAC